MKPPHSEAPLGNNHSNTHRHIYKGLIAENPLKNLSICDMSPYLLKIKETPLFETFCAKNPPCCQNLSELPLKTIKIVKIKNK